MSEYTIGKVYNFFNLELYIILHELYPTTFISFLKHYSLWRKIVIYLNNASKVLDLLGNSCLERGLEMYNLVIKVIWNKEN